MSKRPVTDRRALIDTPYVGEHIVSRHARNQAPQTFTGLLHWFLEGFAAETPEAVHAAGVWFGRPARIGPDGQPVESIPDDLVGGSQLGAPKQAEPFRQLIENSPRQVAGDGPDEHYVRPMRAALAKLAGHHACTVADRAQPGHECGDKPFMARYLLQVAYAQGDWRSVATRWSGVLGPGPAHYAFTAEALRRLHSVYRPDPPARYDQRPSWVDQSDAQRAATEAGEKHKGVA